MMAIDVKATGERLRKVAKERGISKKTIQQRCGVSSVQAVYKWFSGKNLPCYENLLEISELTGVSMDDLIVKEKVN